MAELMEAEHATGREPSGASTATPARPAQGPMTVEDIMSTEVITVAESETVFSAAAKMSEHGVSCVIVIGLQGIAGVLTEKDVLKGVAQPDTDFRRLLVQQRMSHPPQVIAADTSLLEAGGIMKARGIKRLPVVRDGRFVGIVTQTDITRGLISMSTLRYVRDIMTQQVATVNAEATAEEAARLMSTRDISCLAVRHHQLVAGMLTEKDLLRRVVALHRNPAQTRVAEIMSCPIVRVSPDHSVLCASKKMETMHLHRLLVMTGTEICGIITQTDVMRAVHSAFAALESQRRALVTQLGSLLQSVVQDTGKLQEFVHTLQRPSGAPESANGGAAGEQAFLPASGPLLL